MKAHNSRRNSLITTPLLLWNGHIEYAVGDAMDLIGGGGRNGLMAQDMSPKNAWSQNPAEDHSIVKAHPNINPSVDLGYRMA